MNRHGNILLMTLLITIYLENASHIQKTQAKFATFKNFINKTWNTAFSFFWSSSFFMQPSLLFSSPHFCRNSYTHTCEFPNKGKHFSLYLSSIGWNDSTVKNQCLESWIITEVSPWTLHRHRKLRKTAWVHCIVIDFKYIW